MDGIIIVCSMVRRGLVLWGTAGQGTASFGVLRFGRNYV